MGISNSSSALPGFIKLSPNVWYLEHAQNKSTNGNFSHQTAQDLIILSTWMAAAPRHIAKYVVGYQDLYPDSPIVIIINGIPEITYRPDSIQIARLRPIVSLVRSCVSRAADQRPRILLHIFSNGGANQACKLARTYRNETGEALPVTSTVFDSCPGVANYWTGLAALKVGSPQFWPLRMIFLGFLHLLLIGFYISFRMVPKYNMIRGIRRSLNDTSLFALDAPRLYIYSKADEMVIWKDVESHANDASVKGWQVDKELYTESKHVSHMRSDPERYWGSVRKVCSEPFDPFLQ